MTFPLFIFPFFIFSLCSHSLLFHSTIVLFMVVLRSRFFYSLFHSHLYISFATLLLLCVYLCIYLILSQLEMNCFIESQGRQHVVYLLYFLGNFLVVLQVGLGSSQVAPFTHAPTLFAHTLRYWALYSSLCEPQGFEVSPYFKTHPHLVSLIISCISSWHHDGHIISTFIIYHIHVPHSHKSLHFHTYLFSMFLVPAITYILLSSFACHVHPCMILKYIYTFLAFSFVSPEVTMKRENLHRVLGYVLWVPW